MYGNGDNQENMAGSGFKGKSWLDLALDDQNEKLAAENEILREKVKMFEEREEKDKENAILFKHRHFRDILDDEKMHANLYQHNYAVLTTHYGPKVVEYQEMKLYLAALGNPHKVPSEIKDAALVQTKKELKEFKIHPRTVAQYSDYSDETEIPIEHAETQTDLPMKVDFGTQTEPEVPGTCCEIGVQVDIKVSAASVGTQTDSAKSELETVQNSSYANSEDFGLGADFNLLEKMTQMEQELENARESLATFDRGSCKLYSSFVAERKANFSLQAALELVMKSNHEMAAKLSNYVPMAFNYQAAPVYIEKVPNVAESFIQQVIEAELHKTIRQNNQPNILEPEPSQPEVISTKQQVTSPAQSVSIQEVSKSSPTSEDSISSQEPQNSANSWASVVSCNKRSLSNRLVEAASKLNFKQWPVLGKRK